MVMIIDDASRSDSFRTNNNSSTKHQIRRVCGLNDWDPGILEQRFSDEIFVTRNKATCMAGDGVCLESVSSALPFCTKNIVLKKMGCHAYRISQNCVR